MKCTECNFEWFPEQHALNYICPHCGSKFHVLDKNVSDLSGLLLGLVKQFGIDIILNQAYILECLRFYLPEQKRDYNFVNLAYASGAVNRLFDCLQKPAANQGISVQQAVSVLEDDYGISADWAAYVIECFADSMGFVTSKRSSTEKLRLTAEKGDASAQFQLALRYLDADKMPEYKYWINQACSSHYPDAQFHYGKYLLSNETGRYRKAVTLLLAAAESGHIDSICYLASQISILESISNKVSELLQPLLQNDNHLLNAENWIQISTYFSYLQDSNQHLKCIENAYLLDRNSYWKIFIEELEKRNAPYDGVLIRKILKDMVDTGSIDATLMLARKLSDSAMSNADGKAAVHWYTYAAKCGSTEAQLWLAAAYENGRLVDKDIDQAIFWYRQASSESPEAYAKVSFKSPDCICRTVEIELQNGETVICRFMAYLNYQGRDYLILEDPDYREILPFRYEEFNHSAEYALELPDDSEIERVLDFYEKERT